jgi:hypothetical protein
MPPDELVVDVYVFGTDVVWYDLEEEQHTDFLENFEDGQ